METNWTIGKGIGLGLKWLAIMGMVIALFQFAQFLIKFQAGYYEKPEVCEIDRPIIREQPTGIEPVPSPREEEIIPLYDDIGK